MSGEVNVRFIALLRLFEQTKCHFVEEKSVKSPKIPPRSSGEVLPGEINAMKSCILCNGRLATMLGEVNMQFIALFRPFERTKNPVCGGKVVKTVTSHEIPPRSRGVGASR